MSTTVSVTLFGKRYTVPDNLTIMTAMEYVGFQLVHGCGCRNGYCGACAVLYRLVGDQSPHACLACRTTVREGMTVSVLPGSLSGKKSHKMEGAEKRSLATLPAQLYPEIQGCIGCNLCTKNCPQGIDVRSYIKAANEGDIEKCASLSFSCLMCGSCSAFCPAKISHAQVAMLARRLKGKYFTPESPRLAEKMTEIDNGTFASLMSELTQMPTDELKRQYQSRVFEE